MTIDNIKVFGVVDALRGMRNPLNSWGRADSMCRCDENDGHILELKIGPNDEKLCKALITGGQPHRKFLRQINVTMDITAPSYWWAEMDTYKIGTTRNSCSLQHKGASRDFNLSDFTFDEQDLFGDMELETTVSHKINSIIETINLLRTKYNNTKDYRYFRLMRQLMPMGYNYKATWSGTYETLLNIYEWRRNHKLIEWHYFCDEIKKLPGMDILLINKDE